MTKMVYDKTIVVIKVLHKKYSNAGKQNSMKTKAIVTSQLL